MKRLLTAISLAFAMAIATVSAAIPGDSWTSNAAALAANVSNIEAVAFNGNIVYFGGLPVNQKIYQSADGASWAEVGTDELPTADNYDYSAVVANSNVYLLGGIVSAARTDDVYVSSGTDLTTWSTNAAALTSVVSAHCSVVAPDADILVIGGLNLGGTPITTVQSSSGSDVSSFTDIGALPAARYQHTCWTLGRHIFVAGGLDASANETQTVYASADNGVTWAEVGTNSLPEARANAGGTVYNDALYLFGGVNSAGTDQETVYRSVDGENWVEVGDDALPAAISGFGSKAVLDGRMWVIGGLNSGSPQDDTAFTVSVIGNTVAPTPVPAPVNRVDPASTADQAGDTSLQDLPILGWVFEIGADASGFPLQFFWTALAVISIVYAGLRLSQVSPDNLMLPTIGVIFLASVWAVIGQGIIPLWLHLGIGVIALGLTLAGRELIN